MTTAKPDNHPPAPARPRRRALPRSLRRALIRRLILLPLVVYVFWCAMLWFKQTDLIFPRHLAGQPTPAHLIPSDVERLWLQIKTPYEGRPPRVEAWFIPGQPGAPLAVYFHGNGELIDHCLEPVEIYRERGYHVLIPEYRGYGRSVGKPSQAAIVDDADRFIAEALARPGVDPSRLIFHGRSLGSGVAAQVALRRPPAVLILESPFSSVARFATGYGAPALLVRSPFRTDRALPKISPRPTTLILHSHTDEIIPFHHATDLLNVAPWARFHELTGSHIAAIRSMPGAWQAIQQALDDGLPTPPAPPQQPAPEAPPSSSTLPP